MSCGISPRDFHIRPPVDHRGSFRVDACIERSEDFSAFHSTDHKDIPVIHVLSDDLVHIVQRQAADIVQRHSQSPNTDLKERTICALSGAARNKNQRKGVAYIFRPATLFQSETWLHGRVDSSVKFARREVASFISSSCGGVEGHATKEKPSRARLLTDASMREGNFGEGQSVSSPARKISISVAASRDWTAATAGQCPGSMRSLPINSVRAS